MSSKLDKNSVTLIFSISFTCVHVQRNTPVDLAIFDLCGVYFKEENTVELLCFLAFCHKHGPKNDLLRQLAYRWSLHLFFHGPYVCHSLVFTTLNPIPTFLLAIDSNMYQESSLPIFSKEYFVLFVRPATRSTAAAAFTLVLHESLALMVEY